ncbi:MAG: glycosyl hydrolase, partial [Muribaculaceae bacterium]|nr:glycosyl hydrolase [Muribaculaceae bacterium]
MSALAQQVMSWDEAYSLADKKLKELTLDEKKGFMLGHSDFYFYGVPEKGIPYLYLSDASQGVHIRKNLTDTTLVKQLEKSTAFPAPIMLTATFNPALAYDYARSVGEECRAGGIEVLLGPGVNITKNAQNGRNYEYMGEDPYLSGLMASNYVKGMQSTGTAACLKHFIGNETEFYRRRSNSIIDERALHEVYMAPFRAGIDAGAAYVMTSYNRVNGEWAGQSTFVIDTLLRRDLGFRGSVMSDWRSVYD